MHYFVRAIIACEGMNVVSRATDSSHGQPVNYLITLSYKISDHEKDNRSRRFFFYIH